MKLDKCGPTTVKNDNGGEDNKATALAKQNSRVTHVWDAVKDFFGFFASGARK